MYYRDEVGLAPVVPDLIYIITEPGFRSYIDESQVFHTLFEDPTLDPIIVAEKLWAENRPLVLSQMAHGLSGTIKVAKTTTKITRTFPFPFLKLPGELCNKVYLQLLKPRNCLKDLTCHTSDWLDPAIFCTSRQLQSEASSTIYKQQITVLVNPMAMACCRGGMQKLPVNSRVQNCNIEIDLSDPRLVMGDRNVASDFSVRILGVALRIVGPLAEDLKRMKFLKELRLSCKRTTFMSRIYMVMGDFLSDYTDTNVLIFPDVAMDRFRKVNGLDKVTIEGDLEEKYVASLLNDMKKPLVDPLPFDFFDRS